MAASYRRKIAGNLSENQRSNEHEELCVFGYTCKLFRDDVRAQQIDDPSSLIPWMGDTSLLIDRFDGRGHLYSLTEYDVHNCKPEPLSEEERAIEKACDEERYLELHVDVREKEIYEEEEVKRLYEALADDTTYTAVKFSYDSYEPNPAAKQPSPQKHVYDEDTEPFYCPTELSQLLPDSVVLPPTAKLNAIIMKTALFVSQHGAQFEIMIKAKQKDNLQFKFMDMDHALNRYYKLVIELIKSGKYTPPSEPVQEDKRDEDSNVEGKVVGNVESTCAMRNVDSVDNRLASAEVVSESSDDEDGGHYLHPSLMSKKREPPKEEPREEVLYYQYPQLPPVPAPTIIPPPPNLKPIIDKMAEYTARNGAAFEQNVRQKKDPRFEFLNDGHVFHPYYLSMKDKFGNLVEEDKERERSEGVKRGKTGVSFSIKSKEPEPTLPSRPAGAKLQGDSDSDESSDDGSERSGSRGSSVPRGESRGSSVPRGSSIPRVSELSRDSPRTSRTSTPTRDELRESRESSRRSRDESRTVARMEDSISEELESRLDASTNGAQSSSTSNQEKLAQRKRKALAFVNLLKRSKMEGSGLNLDMSSSPLRTGDSGSQSPLPELPDI